MTVPLANRTALIHMPDELGDETPVVVMYMDPYWAANLRWLLRMALHEVARGLNTGDWCAEILFTLEDAMLQAGPQAEWMIASNSTNEWPLEGWR